MPFQFKNFKNYFSPDQSICWQTVAKTGIGFILFGYIAILLKEILIAILSFFLFSIGFILLIIAFRLWYLNSFHSSNPY
jgi:hypothetical protein|tara:strand:- start:806 stop:1042 length:237 start_codon:yes stop_codon:yes gene_type:complete